MATKQMEEIQKKLEKLNYPRANAPAQSLLFAGMERYALLEWLFFRLLGDKSPFPQQHLQGDAMERDEEAARIQYLAEIARFLGITPTIDTEAIQGRGSYENRAEMLRLIVDLVEVSCNADTPEWSVDEQAAKDIQLLDAIAEKQAQVFSEECKLFPADVQIQSNFPVPDISELEDKLSEQTKRLSSLQQIVNELASKQNYNPNEDHTEAEAQLRLQLEAFLETARAFNVIYTKTDSSYVLLEVGSRTCNVLLELSFNTRVIPQCIISLVLETCSRQRKKQCLKKDFRFQGLLEKYLQPIMEIGEIRQVSIEMGSGMEGPDVRTHSGKEIRPWTHMMELPQLHGLGPAANTLLETYKVLQKFLRNLRNLRDSYAAVAIGSEATIDADSSSPKLESSSVSKIITECEEALTTLNRDLGILSAACARDQGSVVPD